MSDRSLFSVAFSSAIAWAALICGPVQAGPADVVLAPHRAVYKLSLLKSTGDKAPSAASGLISYDFSGSACEGYATSFRQVTEMQPPEGESRMSDMRSVTFEDGPAKQFRFNTKTTYNGSGGGEDLDGKAAKNDAGAVAVDLAKPAAGQAVLKPALFPTEHLRTVVDTARTGGRLLSAPVYDGSESGKIIFDTLSVIGAPGMAGGNGFPGSDGLKDLRRWPVTISYFDQNKSDSPPNYVLSFDLYENGVSQALRLNYGSFTLAGELVELKLLPAQACPK